MALSLTGAVVRLTVAPILPLDFSESYGGLLCQNHWDKDPHRLHASPRAIFTCDALARLISTKWSASTSNLIPKQNYDEFLDVIYTDMVGVTPKAKAFLDQMHQWQGSPTR